MRIISQFKDFYDYGGQIDRGLVFKREFERVADYPQNGIIDRIARMLGGSGSYTGILFVCNIPYMFVDTTPYSDRDASDPYWGLDVPAKIVAIAPFDDLVFRDCNVLVNDNPKRSISAICKSLNTKIARRRAYANLDSKLHEIKNMGNICDQLGAPIVAILGGYCYLNPNLSEWRFGGYFNAYELFHDVQNWVIQENNKRLDNAMVKISDADKIFKAGFDTKVSFRHRK